jgi:SOS-response transcriptional repressor LexA
MTAARRIPIRPLEATPGTPPAAAQAPELEACASAEPFALMVLGDSMQPEFDDRDVIVIEPEGLASDGAYVLARVADEWIFRQLVRAGERWRLQPLNPAYPSIDLDDLSPVRGVVIQKSRPGRRRAAKRYVA